MNLLKANPAIWGSVHTPLILELICSIWQTTPEQELATIITLPELYAAMVNKLWLRYLTKIQARPFMPEEVTTLTRDLNYDLASLAATGFSKNEIILSGTILMEVYSAIKRDVPFSTWSSWLKESGFIRPVSKQLQDSQYYFIHLSFQEYFAGFYQAQGFIANDSKVKELLNKHKYNPVYSLMWQFTVGSLYRHYKNSHNPLPLLTYWQTALNSIDIRCEDYFKLIIAGLEACAADTNLAIHHKLFEQVRGILFNHKYNELLLLSPQLLQKCLLRLPNQLTENEVHSLAKLLEKKTFNAYY